MSCIKKGNICDNGLETLLDNVGSPEDMNKARLDLEDMEIRQDLHIVETNCRCFKPRATCELTQADRRKFSRWLCR